MANFYNLNISDNNNSIGTSQKGLSEEEAMTIFEIRSEKPDIQD